LQGFQYTQTVISSIGVCIIIGPRQSLAELLDCVFDLTL
jgi:hypothetical protein